MRDSRGHQPVACPPSPGQLRAGIPLHQLERGAVVCQILSSVLSKSCVAHSCGYESFRCVCLCEKIGGRGWMPAREKQMSQRWEQCLEMETGSLSCIYSNNRQMAVLRCWEKVSRVVGIFRFTFGASRQIRIIHATCKTLF